jgi:hypothetical protein
MKPSMSLRGGGGLDYGQAVFLALLEQRYGNLAQAVSAGAGTSAGGINLGFLALGMKMSELADFYVKLSPSIFHQDMLSTVGMAFGSKYNPDARQKALQSVFGDAEMGDLKIPCFFTAHSKSSGRNFFFQNYGSAYEDRDEVIVTDPKVKLWEVIMATSAAPTYFPGYTLNGEVLFDGGLTMLNDPSETLMRDFPSTPRMLSVGNGWTNWLISPEPNPGALNALSYFVAAALRAAEITSIYNTKRELGNNHLLVNPNIGNGFEIDDTTEATRGALALAWTNEYSANIPALDAIFS